MLDLNQSYSSSGLLDGIKARIFRLIGRAKLTTISNSKKTQLVQVKALKDETITDIERFQEYGFETYPKADAETLIIFPGGNRDQGSVVCIMDSRYRPTDLKEGEVQVYDWNGSQVYFKSDKSILVKSKSTVRVEDANGNYMESTTTQWDLNGNLTIDK
jgi:phage baseplate assembly protein V